MMNLNYKANLNDKYKQFEGTPVHPFHSFIIEDSKILEIDFRKIINKQSNFYRVIVILELIKIKKPQLDALR